jgi:proteasome maturation protein
VKPNMPATFKAPQGHSGPSEESGAAQLAHVHPLKLSEANVSCHKVPQSCSFILTNLHSLQFEAKRHNLNLQILRQREGLAAPLKLTMELKAVSQIGHLPFLPTHNASRDVLLGLDEGIGFNDFLGTQEFSEVLRQPHAVMEKALNIF